MPWLRAAEHDDFWREKQRSCHRRRRGVFPSHLSCARHFGSEKTATSINKHQRSRAIDVYRSGRDGACPSAARNRQSSCCQDIVGPRASSLTTVSGFSSEANCANQRTIEWRKSRRRSALRKCCCRYLRCSTGSCRGGSLARLGYFGRSRALLVAENLCLRRNVNIDRAKMSRAPAGTLRSGGLKQSWMFT